MEIAIIILLSITFIALVVLLILQLKKKPTTVDRRDDEAINRLSNDIAGLKASLPGMLEKNVLENRNLINEKNLEETKRNAEFQEKIQMVLKQGSEDDTKRLLAFEQNLANNLKNQMDSINKKVDDNLVAIHKKVDESLTSGFKGTSDSMEKIQKALGEINAVQKSMENIGNEVTSLKTVLTNSQQRGRYGEMQLEMIIQSMFGEAYKGELYDFQYCLKSGKDGLRPDAVIFLDGAEKKQVMVIDSKFSLVGYEDLFGDSKLSEEEAIEKKKLFKNALTNSIKEVAKYVESGEIIRPAIHFIPNDGVFAYVENEFPDLVDDARRKSVILASPTILQPIIASFKVVQLDAKRTKNLEKINKTLNDLGNEFKRFSLRWEKIEKSIDSLSKNTGDFSTTVSKMNRKFASISSSEIKSIEVEEQEPAALTNDNAEEEF
ncbi:MAG: DNA recombination protein RmuC [Candidatus Enteromonas sp.]